MVFYFNIQMCEVREGARRPSSRCALCGHLIARVPVTWVVEFRLLHEVHVCRDALIGEVLAADGLRLDILGVHFEVLTDVNVCRELRPSRATSISCGNRSTLPSTLLRVLI